MTAAPVSKQSVPDELLLVRQQIDRIDQSLVLMLANRFALTRRVGELKAAHKLEAFDPERERCKLEEIRSLCGRHGVNPELVAEILEKIMREVVINHRAVQRGE